MGVRILIGDVRERLRALPDGSVHCVVTSPPYWGLRDYGTAQWEGGGESCDHKQGRPGAGRAGGDCKKCGAKRIDSQLGLEPTWQDHITVMVEVFREVRRVLRKDGTLWLNYGDTYASSVNGRSAADTKALTDDDRTFRDKPFSTVGGVLKPKDLCGIPWRAAFALQADGWYLRQDIIWSKPNPMPESITDRCTKAHEYIFLMAKSARYFYDAEAIREEPTGRTDTIRHFGKGDHAKTHTPNYQLDGNIGRNKRSVWTIATQPFSEAHFATFPPELAETCIKAGCPEKCCGKCGAPWVREVEKSRTFESGSGRSGNMPEGKYGAKLQGGGATGDIRLGPVVSTKTLGFSPSCQCNAEATPGTVLDPFGGAGTTGLVADRLGRNAILIELNPQYAELARKRVYNDLPMFVDVAAE